MHTISLEEKNAIVTGGSAGIGKEIAGVLLDSGAQVFLFDIDDEAGKEAVKELSRRCGDGKRVHFYSVDVSLYDAVHDSIGAILEDTGHIDIVVNNAGITRDNLLMKMSEQEWNLVLDVNLKSVYNMCHALVRLMAKARSGKIINIASVIGLMGNAGQVNYAASKAGVIALTKSLAKELAPRGVCVNSVAPGYIRTRMTEKLSNEIQHSVIQKIPLGRMGEPEDVAQAVLFLASDLSGYITGQVIVVDGGMVM